MKKAERKNMDMDMSQILERLIPYLDRCRGLTDMKTKRLVITVLRSSALDIYRKDKREQIQVSLDAEDFLDRGVNTIDDYLRIPIFILRLPELNLTAAPMIPYSFMI